MTDEQKEKKRKLLSDRQLRSLQGYDPNPPLCGNCKRLVKPLAGDNMSPFCWLRGLNVSSVAVCDFWLGHQGATLEDAPCQKNLPCKKPGDGVDEGVFLERLKENLRNLPAMLAAAPAAPEQQEPTKECWCETCDLSRGNPMGRTRMSVCPQCGDKRCPRAKHHDSACQVAKASNAQQATKQALTDPENQPNQYGFECFMKGQKMAFRIGNQTFTLDYEPDETEEFDFMRDMLANAFSTFTPDVKAAQQAEPMCRIAKVKLADLIERGHSVCGVMIEKTHSDGKVTRGAVSNGGMVIWWHPESMEAAHSNAQQAEAYEPCALAHFAENGNIQIWSKKPDAEAWSGPELVPLFTRHQPAQLQRLSEEEVMQHNPGPKAFFDGQWKEIVEGIQSAIAAKNGVDLK